MGGSDCLFCATSFCWAAGAKAGGLEAAVWLGGRWEPGLCLQPGRAVCMHHDLGRGGLGLGTS